MVTALTSSGIVSTCAGGKATGRVGGKMVNRHWWMVLFLVLFYPFASHGAITITQVSTTPSSCVNNGTAYVFAYSIPSSSLLYAIVAGPLTTPIQSNPYFPSLFPGQYTVRVYDNNFDSSETQFTITGNYRIPSLIPIVVNPTCAGSMDGKIIGNIDSTSGLAPYTWEIISPGYLVPTNRDTFTNLYAGSYDVRVMDACGNYQTRITTLSARGTDLGYWQSPYYTFPNVTKIGCDTIAFTMWFTMNKDARYLPLKLRINTWDTSYTKPFYAEVFDSVNFSPAWMTVSETIPNMTYGDYLNVCIIDTCGIQVCSYFNQIAPFSFNLQYYNGGVGCNSNIGAYVYINSSPYYNFDYTSIKMPGRLTLRDVATNTIVYRDSCSQYCGFNIPPQVIGRNYELTITDGCGDVFQQTYLWPSPAPPAVQPSTGIGCSDSTAIAYMNCQNFMSMLKVELLSGPAYAHSTKPGYQYSDTIIYPVVFTNIQPGGMAITNLPEGTYQYRVSDSCGHVVTGTLVIQPNQLSDLNYNYHIKRGCLGNNTLFYDPTSGMTVASMVSNAATGQQIRLHTNGLSGYDSITNVQPGKYVVTIWYGTSPYGGGGGLYSVTPNHDCWKLEDTITVYPYDNSTFQSTTTIMCNGMVYVQLNVDSSKGVPPYQYEIMSGPQTFPLQDSALFQLNSTGTYVIRIRDACANSNIQQITIDTAAIAPIVKRGILCVGSRVTLTSAPSPYFTYDWRRPNGTHYLGDTLTINPFAITDTGVYRITKYVHINGCIDTFTSAYHLTTRDSFPQTVVLCSGDSLQVGNRFYHQTGIYRDTLRSLLGCDSIIISNLTVITQTNIINDTTICLGQRLIVGNHIYTLSGTYHDSIAVAACYQYVTTNLTVVGSVDTITPTICNGDTFRIGNHAYVAGGIYSDTLNSSQGCDSIIVTHLRVLQPYSFSSFSICRGDSVMAAGYAHFASGITTDTVTTATGCDSIIDTRITYLLNRRDTIDAQVCSGGSYTFGGRNITSAGTYYDTIHTIQCDSIVMLNLTVTAYLTDTIRATVCTGHTYAFHGISYSVAGTYRDTVTGANCDSIVTLILSVSPYLSKTINQSICPGRSYNFYGNTLSQAGTYRDTVTGANCDSIVTLILSVSPYLSKTVNQSICPGRSYNFYGNSISQVGTYRDTVTGPNCDSIITLNLVAVDYLRATITRTICTGQSIAVGSHSYNQTGTYHDTIATATCDSIVILNLTVNSYLRDTINQTICNGESITVGTHHYTQAGTYRDTLGTAACDSIVVLTLTVKPISSSVISATICEGKTYDFNGQLLGTTGVYTDTAVSATGCDSVVTLALAVEPRPFMQINASTQAVHAGDTVQLNATITQSLTYYWSGVAISDSIDLHPWAIINGPTWIYLTGTSANQCSALDSIYISILEDTIDCEKSGVYIPNIFSPNGDGANDKLMMFGVNITLDKFEVYNRWGELVFQTQDINEGWDGSYKGEMQPPDVFVYHVSYTSCNEPLIKYKKGSITLFR